MSPDNSVNASRCISPRHPRTKHYLLIGVLVVAFLFDFTSDLIQPGLIFVLIAVTKGTVRRGRGERERERERESKMCMGVLWVCGWVGEGKIHLQLTTDHSPGLPDSLASCYAGVWVHDYWGGGENSKTNQPINSLFL